MKKIYFVIALSALLSSCTTEEKAAEPQIYYSSLKMQPELDSLYLSANNESRQLTLVGTIVNTTEKRLSNTGLITDAKYTIRTSDTSFQYVENSKAQWLSSNSTVATVSNGLIIGKSAGYALISAKIGTTTSKSMVVNVRAVDMAPGLSLNPPPIMLTFENSATVSGIVQQEAKLSVSEPNSGFSNPAVTYSANGSFAVTVTGLNQGLRIITARATHKTNNALYTQRSKTVIYYAPNTPEANQIVGNWLGTTLGKDFNFRIENSIIPTRYDITGKIDIQFEGVGLVQNINLIGVLNPNGTIDATLSTTHQGFSITGKFSGYFKSTGTGEGEYSAQAVKTGWPKVSFNDKWTAVKVP